MLVPPSGDTAIERVEYQGHRDQGRGGEERGQRLAAHVDHGEKHRRHPAGCVGQSEKVGQVKLANHREVFGGIGLHWAKDAYGRRVATELFMPEKIVVAAMVKVMKGWGQMPRISVPVRPT